MDITTPVEQRDVTPEPPSDNFKDSPVTREFEIPLTKPELAELATVAGGLQSEISNLKKSFSVVQKQHRADVSGLEEKLEKILTDCDNGRSTRTVDVIERKDYNRRLVQYIYDDRVIQERALEESEMQETMFSKPSDHAPAPDKDPDQVSIDEQIAADIRESTRVSTASSAVQ